MMRLSKASVGCIVSAAIAIVWFAETGKAQQSGASVKSQDQAIGGQVRDEQGGTISNASVIITDPQQIQHFVKTGIDGKYAFAALAPGTYGIRISADNFSPYDNRTIKIAPGQTRNVNVTLRIALKKEEITVFSGNPLIQGAEYGGSNIILRGAALEALPDGPGGLEMMLRALALRTPGPFGPPILVNGFEDSPIPLKQSIREIRINDNPFSAEYFQLGLGRVEIFTKPGTDKLHSDLFFYFGDSTLNSRNPFASNRAPFQSRLYGGDVSGPIVSKRATFFMDFSREQDRSNAVINANVLDSRFNVTPFDEGVVTPDLRRSFGPRVDLQLNSSNTLTARYADTRTNTPASAIGGFSLLSRSQNATTAAQTVQLTETAVLNTSVINETRVQYLHNRSWQSGNNSTPVISVPGAFTGGGADVSLSYDRDNRTELQNFTSWQLGRHVIKAGVQLRYISRVDGSTQNFGGTYSFDGRLAPELNPFNQIVFSGGVPVSIPITGLEAYRRTLLFGSLGFSTQAVRNLGGGPSQFSLTAGTIETPVRQYELAGFVQEDWRLHPNFSLNLGLRWESQDNISDHSDFAPRIGFAWGLGGGKEQPKTVLRGGVGLFYNRINDRLVLRARQLNGLNQRQFITSQPAVLDLFPVVPSLKLLGAIPPATVQLAPGLRTPYTGQASIAIERQLANSFSIAATYSMVRTVHMLRSRDINAPNPALYNPQNPGSAIRPFPNTGDIFEYESSGVFNQHQLLTNLFYRTSKRFSLWTTYTWSDAKSDTDGADTFPSNNYDLRSEYGRSSLDVRHTVYWGGWITLRGGIDVIPLVLWRSGMPFNITTGLDNNGDSLFNDRPAFATDLSRSSVVITPYGPLDLNPIAGQRIIPRNYGEGASFFIANLRVAKRFKLNEKFSMTLSVQATNLFNHTNFGLPVGNLSSPIFGTSSSAAGDWGLGSNQAGNRRLDLGLIFSF